MTEDWIWNAHLALVEDWQIAQGFGFDNVKEFSAIKETLMKKYYTIKSWLFEPTTIDYGYQHKCKVCSKEFMENKPQALVHALLHEFMLVQEGMVPVK